MRAKLKSLFSPDIDDLEKWSPDHEPFGFLLTAMIGLSDDTSSESFDLMICTPEWFAAHKMGTGIAMGTRTLFVARYDYRLIKAFLERAVQRAEGNSWTEIAEHLSWLGTWEFEHYRPAP